MPSREPSIFNFICDLFVLCATSVLVFAPLIAVLLFFWLAWKVFG